MSKTITVIDPGPILAAYSFDERRREYTTSQKLYNMGMVHCTDHGTIMDLYNPQCAACRRQGETPIYVLDHGPTA